jgi:polyhydroxyalkanoate synthase subunit PhaC
MNVYEAVDLARRWQGRVLDTLGCGPRETPSRRVLALPLVTLKAYAARERAGPAVLIVPAPIKRAYIWDLAPEVSVVRQLLRRGHAVYLLQWERPGNGEQNYGIAEYAGELVLRCIDAIEAEGGGRRVTLAGHSLGGTFCAIFAALHPERVQALLLLGAPIQFGQDAGAFAPLVAGAPPAQLVTALFGNVPGTFLDVVSVSASPASFVGARWTDRLMSLADVQALHTHARVERWSLDEQPFPPRLFEDVVELLYRENRFMRGTLTVEGRQATPEHVSSPLLSVIEPRSRVVPPTSALPFHEAVSSAHQRVLEYEGDVGVGLQHVGMLVGRSAHAHLWPEILDWLEEHVSVNRA